MLVRLLVCAVMLPAAVSAQASIEVGPLVALYRPVGHYEHTAAFFRVGTPDNPDDNRATGYGAEARVWVNRSFALQLQGMTSTADHPTVYTPGGGPISSFTQVTSATAQVVYAVSPAFTRSRFWLSRRRRDPPRWLVVRTIRISDPCCGCVGRWLDHRTTARSWCQHCRDQHVLSLGSLEQQRTISARHADGPSRPCWPDPASALTASYIPAIVAVGGRRPLRRR